MLFYAGFAFLILYANLFGNNTHTAGYDFFNYNWNFWWIRHALTTPGLNIYENNFVMAPVWSNYGYHALTAFWYPAWALLEPLVGTLTAVNVIIFIGCFLNGWLLYLLLRDEGVHPALALIGGAALQALPIARYFYYNTHLNLMDWFWLPGLLLLWKAIVRNTRSSAGNSPPLYLRAVLLAVLFGVALWGLLLTDLQFPIFAAFLLVPYGAYTLFDLLVRRQLHAALRLIGAGVLAVVVALALMWFAGPFPYILRFEGELIPGPAEDRPGIPFPGGFLSMADDWWNWDSPSTGAFVTVVIAAAVILSLSKFRRKMPRNRWLWFWLILPPFILAMGPTLYLGETPIPLPYRWMHELTNGMFRMPWRLAPIFVIAGMLFAGKVFTPLLPLINRQARPLAFAAVLLALGVSVRLFETAPLQPAPRSYGFYEAMAQEPYDYVVLQAPTGAGTGEVLLGNVQAIQLQYYGIVHHKRMVNGFISRTPIDAFWYLNFDDPMLAWLGQRRLLESDAVRAQLAERIESYPIGYIVLHTDLIGQNTATVQEIVGYFNQLDDLLCFYTVEADAIVYRTRWHPDGCPDRTPPQIEPGIYQVDIGTQGDERYLGWGYHWSEQIAGVTLRWTGAVIAADPPDNRLTADIYVDLPPGEYDLVVAMQAFWEARQITLEVNGIETGDPVEVGTGGLGEYTWHIPAEAIGNGQHLRVTLRYDAVTVPVEVGQSADQRRLAVAVDWLRFAQR